MTKGPISARDGEEAAVYPWSDPSREHSFLENDEIRAIRDRALDYARAGVPVHLSGPAGLGKTSMAFEVARALGREIAVMTGNKWLSASDFVGAKIGSTSSDVVDRYVHSVRKTETRTRSDWGSSMLARAMVKGQTLIYDEFTRATPEANSTLLSVLEEGLLIQTDPAANQRYIRAHPDFRILLTSNPHDYVAVNEAPDALLDRVATLPMLGYGSETVAMIVRSRTGLDHRPARQLADFLAQVHGSSEGRSFSVLRTALLVGRIAAHRAKTGSMTEDALFEIAADILRGRGVEAPAPNANTAIKRIAAE